jgi:hypothetical protein
MQARMTPQLGARSRPYLSTLQPHLGHVQPPHITSPNDLGLRIADRFSPQRGQEVPRTGPMPHLPFVFDCFRMNMKPAIRTAAPISMSQVAGSIESSRSRQILLHPIVRKSQYDDHGGIIRESSIMAD